MSDVPMSVLDARKRLTDAMHAMHVDQRIAISVEKADELNAAWDAYDDAIRRVRESAAVEKYILVAEKINDRNGDALLYGEDFPSNAVTKWRREQIPRESAAASKPQLPPGYTLPAGYRWTGDVRLATNEWFIGFDNRARLGYSTEPRPIIVPIAAVSPTPTTEATWMQEAVREIAGALSAQTGLMMASEDKRILADIISRHAPAPSQADGDTPQTADGVRLKVGDHAYEAGTGERGTYFADVFFSNGEHRSLHKCYSTKDAALNARTPYDAIAGGALTHPYQGTPDPDRPGRVLHPINLSENPTFLPGDKVRDRRDHSGKVWRIVARLAHYDDEYITLREVGDDSNERRLLASSVVPHLEMVAMFKIGSAKMTAGEEAGNG